MSPKENPQPEGQGILKSRFAATKEYSPNNSKDSIQKFVFQTELDDRPERELGHIANPSAPMDETALAVFIHNVNRTGGGHE